MPKNLTDMTLNMWNGKLPVDMLVTSTLDKLIAAIDELIQARIGSHFPVRYEVPAVRDYYGSMALMRWNNAPVVLFDPLSTFYATLDGFIRIHANYLHHRMKLYAVLGLSTDSMEVDQPGKDPEKQDSLECKSKLAQIFLRYASSDIEKMIISAGGIAGTVRTPAEYTAFSAEHPVITPPEYPIREGKARLLARSALYKDPAHSIDPMRPLSGIRVLNLTRVLAGPSAGRLLGALGAEVLRIDPPHIPEILAQHLDLNHGVHSALADYRNSEELDRVHELLAQADAVLLGYRPGALVRFGLDPATLTERYPHLSIASLSAWQQRENSIYQRGFDSIVQAVTGISAIYSHAGKPGALPVQALDMTAGLTLALHIIRDISRDERSTRHYTLEGFSQELQKLAHAGKQREKALDPTSPHTAHAESVYGSLDYVPPPLWIDQQRLDYAFPTGKYGSAPLSWNE